MFEAFSAPGNFWRGNIHGHSTRSDGVKLPEEVADHYRNAGYDFISITDHFMKKYNFPITDTTALRGDGFTTIIGAELHAPSLENGEIWHIVAIGLPLDFAPPHDQETGPEIARRAAATGAFIQLPHPEWYNLSADDARTIEVAHAVEIYNHAATVQTCRGGGVETIDRLLQSGRRVGIVATDDSHFRHYDACGGWTMVKAVSNTPEELVAALKAGHYYSSQGPLIHNITRLNDQIIIECSPVETAVLLGPGRTATRQLGSGMTRIELSMEAFQADWARLVLRDAQGQHAWTNAAWFA